MDIPFLIFSTVVFIFSVIIHEVAHGYAAYLQGDNTAKFAGRLTLNPLPHIDPFGSVLLPLILLLTGSPMIIGWAKPVPFNPYNLRNQRWGEALVAIAGPGSNLLIAVVFGVVVRFGLLGVTLTASLLQPFLYIVLINLVLATFNLVPIPPLDGSKILFSLFPASFIQIRTFYEKYGFFLLIIFVFFLWDYLSPVILREFVWLTGYGM